ncbi:MAG: patatin-like phospholipase family protein [Acidobacteriota bacterium]|nr:patatin-like phospholipase family protein [Acidobacteriota bacterium]
MAKIAPSDFTRGSEPYRLLSMDGGGIYGLATAIMLRKLCERDPDFLTGSDIFMFTGTSAGAINALLLAKSPKPREVALSGELESFWKEAGVYAAYDNLWLEWYALWGLIPWFATDGYIKVLKKYFGDLRLCDLPQRVMVTSFRWSGSQRINSDRRSWRPKMFYNFPLTEIDRRCKIVDVAYGAGAPPGYRRVIEGDGDGGIFVPNPCTNAVAKVVAFQRAQISKNMRQTGDTLLFAAGLHRTYYERVELFARSDAPDGENGWDPITVEGIGFLNSLKQALGEGLPDFEAGESNDAENALISEIDRLIDEMNQGVGGEQPVTAREFLGWFRSIHGLVADQYLVLSTLAEGPAGESMDEELRHFVAYVRRVSERTAGSQNETKARDALMRLTPHFRVDLRTARGLIYQISPQNTDIVSRIAMFSMGVCTQLPYYWPTDINLGWLNFNYYPTNIPQNNWWWPSYFYSLDAPSEDAVYECTQLLGRAFYRMNPPLLQVPQALPTLKAMALAKYDFCRRFIVNQVERVTESPTALEAVTQGLEFLRSPWWNHGSQSMNPSIPPVQNQAATFE